MSKIKLTNLKEIDLGELNRRYGIVSWDTEPYHDPAKVGGGPCHIFNKINEVYEQDGSLEIDQFDVDVIWNLLQRYRMTIYSFIQDGIRFMFDNEDTFKDFMKVYDIS